MTHIEPDWPGAIWALAILSVLFGLSEIFLRSRNG
jgi:hypothetical protein